MPLFPASRKIRTCNMASIKTLLGYSDGEDVFAFSNADAEIMLAHVSDFGTEDANEQLVADLVYEWKPSAIFTSGDNSQGGLDYDDDVEAYYGEYVGRNLMWPCPGNHDYNDGLLACPEYFAYFNGSINNRYYYKKTFGPVSLFMLDSVAYTPDGVTTSGAQYAWLARELQSSRSTWNIVSCHYPPYSSASERSPGETGMRWGFGALGADIVISGHNHQYERLYYDTYYIVAGTGGQTIRAFDTPLSGSQFRYNDTFGAGRLIVSPTKLRWEWRTYDNALVDSITLET